MTLRCGRPSSSTQVRTWCASGRKLLDCRDQSRGPAGPEIIAYISSITAPISLSSLTGEAERSPDWHDCDNLQPARDAGPAPLRSALGWQQAFPWLPVD